MGTNTIILVLVAVMMSAAGVTAFTLIHVPLVLLAGGAGIWLFYVQHQFEQTHWTRGENWSAHEAALHGSSHYDLPKILRWITANIGLHHIHHLSSRIPFYRLPEVLQDYAELRILGRITVWESIRGLRLVLWDEKSQRLISFKTLRTYDRNDRAESHATPEARIAELRPRAVDAGETVSR